MTDEALMSLLVADTDESHDICQLLRMHKKLRNFKFVNPRADQRSFASAL